MSIKNAQQPNNNPSAGSAKLPVTCLFAFGEWVLIDGWREAQYLHQSTTHLHTVDIFGIWSDVTLDRITKDKHYLSANGR